jgi:hypothetical protein
MSAFLAANCRVAGWAGSPVRCPESADPDHFRDYYVSNHLPQVTRMPGLLAWRYSFEVAATQGQTPYFAVFTVSTLDPPPARTLIDSDDGRLEPPAERAATFTVLAGPSSG